MPRLNWQIPLALLVSPWFTLSSFAVEFASPNAYAVGSGPQTVVAGDFNGDGKLDLAVLNTASNNVSILLGNGDGTFQSAQNFDIGASPFRISVADFNADGKLDLAVFTAGSTAEIRILLGNGDGTFKAPMVTSLTMPVRSFGSGDFNGDKKADLIVVTADPNGTAFIPQILLGNGDGTFQPAKAIAASLLSPNFAIADFNKDGKLDLAIQTLTGLLVLQGQGDGTFVAAATVTPLPLIAINMRAADLNNDGNLDLLVDSQRTFCGGTIIHVCSTTQDFGVFLGAGNGSFSSEQLFAHSTSFGTRPSITSFAVGDLNGDGKLDIVYRNRFRLGFALQVALGKGDGTFSVPILFPDQGPIAEAQDFNGDKLADVITLDFANGNVDVLLNDSPGSGTDLAIISSSASPEPVGVGTTLTYTADVLNEGPHDATGVTFKDTLPASVTFVSATASQGSCSHVSQMVTCVIGALSDAADATVTIVVTPNTASSITNNMDVTGNESDLALANNSTSQISTVLPVYTLTVTKSGNGTGTVSGGQGINGTVNCGATCSAQFLSGTIVNLNASPDTGSLLQSWGGACAGTPNNQGCTVTMNSDLSVSAAFVLGITLSVTITGGGTGSVNSNDGSIACNDSGGTCSSLNLPGSQVSLAAAPSGGSQFTGWSGTCSGSNPNSCSFTLNANQTVTANIIPPPTFTVSPGMSSLTGTAGATLTDVLTLSGQNGFTGPVNLVCGVTGGSTQQKPTCSLSPSTVNAGATAVTSTLSLNLPLRNALVFWPTVPFRSPAPYFALALFAFLALAWRAARVEFTSRPALRLGRWILGGSMAAVLFLCACGGGSSGPPPPQNYVVTVTAMSGAISQTTHIQLTVN